MSSADGSKSSWWLGVTFIAFCLAVLAAFAWPMIRPVPVPVSTASVVRTAQVSDTALLTAEHRLVAKVQYSADLNAWRAEQAKPKPPPVQQAPAQQAAPSYTPPPPSYTASAGAYSYAGLEQLWVANGGSVGTESVAACIAEHESSGVANAFNGRDIGLWQIDPGHDPNGNLYNADENARIAVQVSSDGTDWSQWTTAPDCGV